MPSLEAFRQSAVGLMAQLNGDRRLALPEIQDQRRTIARLEAGERRFTCRKCGVVVYTSQTEPPPSWWPAHQTRQGQADYHCQDCADISFPHPRPAPFGVPRQPAAWGELMTGAWRALSSVPSMASVFGAWHPPLRCINSHPGPGTTEQAGPHTNQGAS